MHLHLVIVQMATLRTRRQGKLSKTAWVGNCKDGIWSAIQYPFPSTCHPFQHRLCQAAKRGDSGVSRSREVTVHRAFQG